MAKRRVTLTLTAEGAQQALAFLVHEGKVAASDIQKALKRREKLIKEVRQRLSKLGIEGLDLVQQASKGAAARVRRAEKASRPARKRAVSAATKAARQAQGRYMASVRQLSKKARKQIKAIREKSGIDAAVTAAKKMAK